MTPFLTVFAFSVVAVAAIYLAIKVVKLVLRLVLIGGAVAVIYFFVFPYIEQLI